MAEQAEKVISVRIEDEIKSSYLDYAMSVIVGRALPDVRDGLKPVHRRILYTMNEMGLTPDKPYRKSARVVGDTMGRYHPHGDAAIYDAMVRMAQDFSCRYTLVDGHGNFGSVDGDSPAAMRYTEVRMSPLSQEMLADIDKDTVDFIPNYDGSLSEPTVLPAKLPQLLMNGSSGIAVGMATNIPPHNLGELIDGLILLIDNKDVEILDLMKVIPGPDFPTGGFIRGREGIKEAYTTGHGSIIIRGRYEKEDLGGGKSRILITELPYQVNKANLIEKIAELIREKRLQGVADLRDESDRRGMCIVIELKRDTNPDVILKYLCKHTQLQISFGIVMLALVDGRPQVLNLKQMLEGYLRHRVQVVRRRSKYELDKAQQRAHILEGLKVALDNLDAIITTIRQSQTVEEARQSLIKKFKLTEIQAQAILDMRLQRLTGQDRKKINAEYKDLIKQIAYLQSLLADERKILHTIREELLAIKERFADHRRTRIIEKTGDIEQEEIIPEEEIIVTITRDGYTKRLPADTYRTQLRGGKGVTATTMKAEDIVDHLMFASTHHYILFFTNKGLVYRLKAYEIPAASRWAKGSAIINLIQIQPGERVTAAVSIKEFTKGYYLFMATEKGVVKKTDLSEFANLPRVGKIALSLDKGDELGWVRLTDGKDEIILVTEKGQAIRFSETEVRPMGRTAKGVRGIRLRGLDRVVGMDIVDKDKKAELLCVASLGYGKRTLLSKFRSQSRGGVGIRAIKVGKSNGEVIGIKVVKEEDEIMLISSFGIMIRMKVKAISLQGRAAQGVRLMRLSEGDKVVALERMMKDVE